MSVHPTGAWFRGFATVSSLAIVSAALVACGGATSHAASSDGGPDSGEAFDSAEGPQDSGTAPIDSGPPMCGAVGISPATITVVSAEGGAIPCDATIMIVGSSDGGGTTLCGGDAGNTCLTSVQDGGSPACTYSVLVTTSVGEATPVTVEVSQPGFQSTQVSGVVDGLIGCVSNPTPASQSTVTLEPLADGGPEGDAAHD
jgi:hypothetical protein